MLQKPLTYITLLITLCVTHASAAVEEAADRSNGQNKKKDYQLMDGDELKRAIEVVQDKPANDSTKKELSKIMRKKRKILDKRKIENSGNKRDVKLEELLFLTEALENPDISEADRVNIKKRLSDIHKKSKNKE